MNLFQTPKCYVITSYFWFQDPVSLLDEATFLALMNWPWILVHTLSPQSLLHRGGKGQD